MIYMILISRRKHKLRITKRIQTFTSINENMNTTTQFKTLEINQKTPNSHVYNLTLNNPLQRNALSLPFFTELPAALKTLDENPHVHVIILSASGHHFCSGIDLSAFTTLTSSSSASGRETLRREILTLQDAITAVERCRKPVIAAVHGGCIGGGVDLVTACDLRVCSVDAFFSVKEVDLGITADLGTLQRLPRIVGYGNAVELALTGRKVSGLEAKEMGLVSRVFGSKEELDEGVRVIAEDIASKSPLAVMGTKAVLLKSKDLTLDQGLDYVATWNSSILAPDEIARAISAQPQKRTHTHSKL